MFNSNRIKDLERRAERAEDRLRDCEYEHRELLARFNALLEHLNLDVYKKEPDYLTQYYVSPLKGKGE